VGDSSSRADNDVDEALEETFPASDAPANTVVTGISTGDVGSPSATVVDNAALNRFELTIDSRTAFLVYERTPDTLRLIHTEVPETLRGRHIGESLVKAALDFGHAERLKIVALCPFVRAYLKRHPPAPSGTPRPT
jgi:uncharacterized protein